MAERQNPPRRNAAERQAPPRRSDVIRCEHCGEDYAITYKRCPFCDERPGRGGSSGGGRRMASNTRGGGYGRPVDPIQIVGLVISMILIIAALFIVFTKLAPLFSRDGDGSASGSSSSGQSSSASSGAASSGASSSGQAGSASSQTPPAPTVQAQAISLSRDDFTLVPGEVYQIIAAVSPAAVTDPIVWTSSNTSLATVDEYGNVTNVNMGSTKETVTITATCGNVSAECIVRCNPGGAASQPSGGSQSGGSTGPVAPNSTGTVVNASNGLNVRSGPGSDHDKIASILNGSRITIKEDMGNGWYKIDYGNGKIGYVSSDYIQVGG